MTTENSSPNTGFGALRPVTFSGGVKSISDDDLCAECRHCTYHPGDMSGCVKHWPGHENQDGYVQACPDYDAVSSENATEQEQYAQAAHEDWLEGIDVQHQADMMDRIGTIKG